ncbi:hypothetical protein A2526_02490 [candidate division WOR-1 bacterium RIFOXYD2_FULL_36_8]|uniref:Glycosyltransferase RgtA/B/C/D-like domain-containing protein n=1 Tax=candidate division WOR-1 bacterium RIFOXYB2_FULL_36_35 TaxID=1802578 RepID=A0A1F4S0J5_UNCSA|nr:MAG: hypothetical protein A2230_09115 [candidate division WOR-1 bacterium RIFOXYA2_FULL_36_21]OGC13965.1 MAG: hypothetical protein A2290_04130 [candidate division WOR-1 bacterium RIFOXYB2_FULL_36_35]OGC18792.1 MAG: hypothetical protein A2282_07045 [candidate division WOR-1 bacterium RIFOXYA12_FULL_36_13]OGC41201.1 MAG: hypothetical protein A2526_02490 [candidate division WOR-1 bacterium RIFOXYD2_FULL_36_8]
MKKILILVLISIFLFFFGLGIFSLWETDEVIYTQVAKEIIQTGDWITLHFQGSPWFIHPPMFMWLTALTGAFLGFSNFIARIWCSIFGLIGVVTVYYFGRLLHNEESGFYSALVLATSFQYILQSRIAIFDIPLIVLMLLAVFCFFKGYKEKKQRYYSLFYIFMGLAVFMKGPIGILLPVFIIILYLFIVGDALKVWKECHPIVGIIFAGIIGGWWYLVEYLINGQVFVDRVIGYYTVNRFAGIVESHTGSWYYYFPVIFLGFLPWSIFLFEGIYNLFKERKSAKENIFILLWIGIGFVFFSMAHTKLPGYIMSLYPYLALTVGILFATKKKMNYSFIALAFVSSLLILLIFPLTNATLLKEYTGLGFALVPMVFTMGGGGLIATILYFATKRPSYALYTIVLSMFIVVFIMVVYTTPIIEGFKANWH